MLLSKTHLDVSKSLDKMAARTGSSAIIACVITCNRKKYSLRKIVQIINHFGSAILKAVKTQGVEFYVISPFMSEEVNKKPEDIPGATWPRKVQECTVKCV